MAISIDESIRLFKTEIIAQDQRLPQRRSEPLLEACGCLKQRFSTRKNVLAILGMTEGVILYMRKHQATANPDCLDFVKEALAHVVNIYEEGKFDPEKEKQLGQRMYKRFNELKRRLKARKTATAAPDRQESDQALRAAAKEQPDPNAIGQSDPNASDQEVQPTEPPPPDPPKKPVIGGSRPRPYAPGLEEPCLLVAIGEFPLLVADSAIALLEPIKPRHRPQYLAATEINLKDFSRLFRLLPRRFKGPLAEIPARRLKKLKLPLIMPRGGSLPPMPPEDADHLLVLSHGQWHGVIPVRLLRKQLCPLQRFQPGANGDIAGLGTTADDLSCPLLNPQTLLEREGFLTTPGRPTSQ